MLDEGWVDNPQSHGHDKHAQGKEAMYRSAHGN